jgi:hypothetical protein
VHTSSDAVSQAAAFKSVDWKGAAQEGLDAAPTWALGAGAGEAFGAGAVAFSAARGATNFVKLGEWTLDPKVARHIGDISKSGDLVRPYLNSPMTLREIMAAGKPIADPRGFPGAVRYDVPGAFRGSEGTWELVVQPESKTVLHWLFRSGP